MKIFFPLQVFYPSQAGGTANVVYWLAKNLSKRGFEPIVVATDMGVNNSVPRNRWLESEAGTVIYNKTRFANFPIRQIFTSFANFHKADIVHLSSIFFPTCFLTAITAKAFSKKVVWSVHGELDQAALSYSHLQKRSVLWVIKNFLSSNVLFHSTSDRETQNIKDCFGDNVKINKLPNYFEVPPRVACKPEKYLLFIGRVHPIKAIDNLIKGLANSESFIKSGFVLKIAGGGSADYKTSLERLAMELGIEKRIVFLDHIEGEEKQNLLADAYFTILPSHSENFGIVVLESLAQETPVIASKGSPWESLEDKKVGFWAENSPTNLAKQIDEILNMPAAEYESYRKRSRQFVEDNFDIKKNIEKWVELYESL